MLIETEQRHIRANRAVVHGPELADALLASTRPHFVVRAAKMSDVTSMVELINGFAAMGVMLPKTPESIALAIDDFVVAADVSGGGRVVGLSLIHI